MRLIVADKMGIVASGVREGLRRGLVDRRELKLQSIRTRSELETELWTGDEMVVIAGQLIYGFKTLLELADRVKSVNPNATFFFFNGSAPGDLAGYNYIPSVPKGRLVGDWILEYVWTYLGDDTPTRQLELF